MSQTVAQIAADPLREKQLTRRAALMIAEGTRTDKEIARDLNISVGTLDVWKKSPLFQELVNAMGDKVEEKGIKAIADSLMEDAPTNISFIKGVRDGAVKDDHRSMRNRLTAAKMLLDKQAPNAGDNISDDARKIILGGRLLGQMIRAMKNEGAIEATAEVEDDPRIAVQTIDEFHAEAQAREAIESEPDPDDSI